MTEDRFFGAEIQYNTTVCMLDSAFEICYFSVQKFLKSCAELLS